MPELEQAARQALEVLSGLKTAASIMNDGPDDSDVNHASCIAVEAWGKSSEAITALREALAEQAELVPYEDMVRAVKEGVKQEPVGYFSYDEEHDIWEELTGPNAPGATPLYAEPVRTKDLSDDEIEQALDAAKVPELPDGYKSVDLEIARAVIAAYKAKNNA